jgi:hypothetical protein
MIGYLDNSGALTRISLACMAELLLEGVLAHPEFGVSEKRTKRNRQSITITTLRFHNPTTALTGGLGAKYLVIVFSRSLKMREFSFAQFDNFLRKMCLFFNF